MDEFVGTGKTTAIFEEAVCRLGDLPESHKVFVTGYHTQWLNTLRCDFLNSGLIGVEVLFPSAILQAGALRGARGILLIDDFYEFRRRDQVALMEEKRILEGHG